MVEKDDSAFNLNLVCLSLRRYTKDPFTVVVAPDESGAASGDLYLDDGVRRRCNPTLA